MVARVRSVLVGRVQALGPTVSGIAKRPVSGPRRVEALGLAGDAQADLRVHGGPDKAVLCYAWSHYGPWRDVFPDQPLLEAPGAFGENLSIDGLDEHAVCIGDRWRIGSALFSVTQGRQPCFKLNLRFGVPDMAARVQASGRAGWYLRVLEPGWIEAGDACELIDRPHPTHSVASVLALIRDRETRPDRLEPVLALPLPASWRRLFEQRLQTGQAEDWRRRLEGA
ncbi:MOSC domain-containing protein [Caldimonas thermodepolymerans]|uniref:MOSC domain-containing protein YiiM n=1 Tax=Caldimonas thermodepolymerans TaxID=215580 RepID=A0AA46DC77_9BURK|nr:MOSC domain-containing protein [Caldimonas thermodepolymerans]TCP05070.1 MOSC domain-containing protein YiiM [Caldimonas thermodepolymerans]